MSLIALLVLVGCTHDSDSDDPIDLFDRYAVDWSTDPAPPMVDELTTVHYTILDDDGQPAEGLQQTHERMVHTFTISQDLTSFAHLHQEDTEPITADNLRTATFEHTYVFPYSGVFLLAWDFAHLDKYHTVTDKVTVMGDVPQLSAPVFSEATTVAVPGIEATLSWDVPPVAGAVSELTVAFADENGAPITDLVPYLGADAHVAVVGFDLGTFGHTHAWIEGMDTMPPGHTMPHQYDGPEVPVHYTFPFVGDYRLWIQVTRADSGGIPYIVPFDVHVP